MAAFPEGIEVIEEDEEVHRPEALTQMLAKHKVDSIRFFLHGETPEEANALRRIMYARVATVAPYSFDVHENTGALPSDLLAQRIGLIPIKADPDALEEYAGGAPTARNSIRFALDVAAEGDSIRSVVSGDMRWVREEGAERFAQPPVPAMDDIVITKLAPGQRLVGEVPCVRGTATDHAKWAPTCASTYETPMEVEVRGPLTGEFARRVVGYYPPGVFRLEGEGAEVEAVPTGIRFYGCPALPAEWQDILRNRYVEEGAPFRFYVESVGALSAREILRRGLRIWTEEKKARATVSRAPNRRLVRLPDGRMGPLVDSGAEGTLLVKPYGFTGAVAVSSDEAVLL